MVNLDPEIDFIFYFVIFMKRLSYQEDNKKLTFIVELAQLDPYGYFNL